MSNKEVNDSEKQEKIRKILEEAREIRRLMAERSAPMRNLTAEDMKRRVK